MDSHAHTAATKNGRSANSFCCALCHQYHQVRKKGRCKFITGSLPGLVEFVKRFDENAHTSFARQGAAFETENALRRVFAFATENKTAFQEWASKSSAEFPLEHYVAPTMTVSVEERPAVLPTEDDPDDPDPDASLRPAASRKGPAPPELMYDFLKSRGRIDLL